MFVTEIGDRRCRSVITSYSIHYTKLYEEGSDVLVTRIDPEKAKRVRRVFRRAEHLSEARCLVIRSKKPAVIGKGTILVVTAGTSDIPVAEEAAVTAEFLGNRVERLFDVGVAGIHRLLMRKEALLTASYNFV